MSIIHVEGFDHFDVNMLAGLMTLGSSVDVTISTTGGRWGLGSGAASFHSDSSAARIEISLGGNFPDIIIGLAYKPAGLGSTSTTLIDFRSTAGTAQMMLNIGSTGTLWLTRGTSTTIVASGTTPLPKDQWSYIEVRLAVADVGGIMQVRVNGNPTPDISYTGDTRNDATYASVASIRFKTGSYFGSFMDDLYIIDALTAPNTTFLGDCRVDTLYPSGAGSSTQWTPSTGNNYACCDERPANTTDYVETNVAGEKDLYAMGNLSQTTSIHAVVINAAALKTDAGTHSIRVGCKTHSKEYWSPDHALAIGYAHYQRIFAKNPFTHIAWDNADVDALEVGVQYVTNLATTAPPTTASPTT